MTSPAALPRLEPAAERPETAQVDVQSARYSCPHKTRETTAKNPDHRAKLRPLLLVSRIRHSQNAATEMPLDHCAKALQATRCLLESDTQLLIVARLEPTTLGRLAAAAHTNASGQFAPSALAQLPNSTRITTRLGDGRLTSRNPAASKTLRAPTLSSPQAISCPGAVSIG